MLPNSKSKIFKGLLYLGYAVFFIYEVFYIQIFPTKELLVFTIYILYYSLALPFYFEILLMKQSLFRNEF